MTSFAGRRAYRKWDRDWSKVNGWVSVFVYASFGLAGYALHAGSSGWFLWFMVQAMLGIVVEITIFAYRMRGMDGYISQIERERDWREQVDDRGSGEFEPYRRDAS